jgi:hypothetical protein
MERYKVPFHVYETEWTFEQFCYLISGIKSNNDAQKAALEEARGDTPNHSRHDAQAFDALKMYIPDSARDEAQYKA